MFNFEFHKKKRFNQGLKKYAAEMKITHLEIYRLTIPMDPFVIATETLNSANNIYIRIHTNTNITGVGECSPFPMLVGETQDTCFHVGKALAKILKDRNPLEINERMADLNAHIAYNTTIKSAFDMALHDIAAKQANLPLYAFLGGRKKIIQTDVTIGIDTPNKMAETAKRYIKNGVQIIKIKLGKNDQQDVERVSHIRNAVGDGIRLRIDANQGWDFITALETLNSIAKFNIEFCEQPMHTNLDPLLPELKKKVPIQIMSDESVFDHYDAERLLATDSCDFINIKLAKSGGIIEAMKIADTAAFFQSTCMLGGMVESRMALTANVHLAMAHENIKLYDLDTCLLGHLMDPTTKGVRFNNYFLELDDHPGIGADIDQEFLKGAEHITI